VANVFKSIPIELPADLVEAAARASFRGGFSLDEFITEAIIEKIAAHQTTANTMESLPRHQCLIYDGSPVKQLSKLAAVMCQKIEEGYRCLYINSPAMIAELKPYLAARSRYVLEDTKLGRLIFSSDQHGSDKGPFDEDAMLRGLEDTLKQSLRDGRKGLWASGDMAWEFGNARDFSRLLEYEWRLEGFFMKHPELEGICQYHTDALPSDAIRQGSVCHPAIFVSETLSVVNPLYRSRGASAF
jgi:hypothetical protein